MAKSYFKQEHDLGMFSVALLNFPVLLNDDFEFDGGCLCLMTVPYAYAQRKEGQKLRGSERSTQRGFL